MFTHLFRDLLIETPGRTFDVPQFGGRRTPSERRGNAGYAFPECKLLLRPAGIKQAEKWIGSLQIVQSVTDARFRCPLGPSRRKAGGAALGSIEEEAVVGAADEDSRNKLIRATPAVG